jgi:hypothetical protein
MADDEIVVEIEKETPESKPSEQTTEPVAALQQQLTDLQAETQREKDARIAADRRATSEAQARQAAQTEVQETRTEIAETRLGTVEQGIAAATTEADAAQSEYTAAMEAGDWKKAGEAQRKISRAEATKVRLEEAKADLEVQKAQPQRQQQRTEAPQTQADPVEAFIQSRDSGTQAWLRDHPEDARILATNSDPRRAAKLNAADADAFSEGLARGSKEYFEHVNKFLGITKTNGKAPTNGSTQTQRRAASAPVAPVAASAGGVSGGTEVRLSANEAKAAVDGTLIWNYPDPTGQNRWKKGDPIGVQEFARRKLALKESGQYDKSLTEQ